jgi:NADH-quinone oxidoreductase subunit H
MNAACQIPPFVYSGNPDRILHDLAAWIGALLAPWPWLQIAVALLLATAPLIAVFPGLFAVATWLERKGLARIQNRLGPNRTGPFGLLQPAADGVKMLLKEDITPARADRLLHFLGPVLIVVPALVVLAVLPIGRDLTAAALETGVLFFFAVGSISTLVLFMAGWASRNKYSLLGGMRVIAQSVSYELPLVLAGLTVVLASGTLHTPTIVEDQILSTWLKSDNLFIQNLGSVLGWNVWQPWGFAGFLIFFVASLAEVNRSPFDLPEADSEIIAGHLTEYSGFKYALFFLGEYVAAFAISGMAVTLFLGGWSGPNIFWFPDSATAGALPHQMLPSFVWFFAKILGLLALMIWVRGTLPRLRVDQLMGFAWKFLMPLALWNLMVVALAIKLPPWLAWPISALMVGAGFAVACRTHTPAPRPRRDYALVP